VLALAVPALALTRRWVAAWAVFAVNLSHLLFDAGGGGDHILYFSNRPDGIPWLLFPLGTQWTPTSYVAERRVRGCGRFFPVPPA
jgi:hypothetical protein